MFTKGFLPTTHSDSPEISLVLVVDDQPGIASSSHSRSWIAFGLVLSAHLAVFAGLRPEPGPLTLETIPEPILVSLVRAPQTSRERTTPSANFEQKASTTMKPKVTEQKTIKRQAKQIPSDREKSARKPLVDQDQNNTHDATDSSLEPISAPVKEAKSPANLDAAKPAIEQSEPSDQAPSFNAAYLNNPAPEYPAISRRLGEQGLVLLSVKVTADGRADAVAVHTSSGWSRLDQAALKGVQKWRFVPARRGGQAVNASVIVPVRFSIEG
ncbi:MAG: TonB family protein [Methylococcales bacterium]